MGKQSIHSVLFTVVCVVLHSITNVSSLLADMEKGKIPCPSVPAPSPVNQLHDLGALESMVSRSLKVKESSNLVLYFTVKERISKEVK